jgi:hypothetical protein
MSSWSFCENLEKQREKSITVYLSLSFAVSRSLSVINVRFLFVICLPEGN